MRARFAIALFAGLTALSIPTDAQRADPQKPNVVLIMADDVGYGDFGSYGAPDVKTPHIDRLAKEGVKLTDFYAAPVCTPTRAALISGRYPQRFGLERQLNSATPDEGLAPSGDSLPQLLKNNGYATGLIGKWHLGGRPQFHPNGHGFDYFFGFLGGAVDYYFHTSLGGRGAADFFENTTPIQEDGYMTDLITARAAQFIERNSSRPFFLEVAYNAPHWPFQPPGRPSRASSSGSYNNGVRQGPDDTPTATRKDYVAMMERLDDGVGELLKTLEKLALTRNTLVIFTNDNGGEWLSRNAPFFHRKDTLWEGGIRVPAIFRWPGHLPAGRTSRQVGVTMDLSASVLAATNTPAPSQAKPDGIDILPMLSGRAPVVDRTLFWRIPGRQRAVRQGEWKLLIDDDQVLLFNLRTDVGERRDVAVQRTNMAATLRSLISAWEKDVDADAPTKRPEQPGASRPTP